MRPLDFSGHYTGIPGGTIVLAWMSRIITGWRNIPAVIFAMYSMVMLQHSGDCGAIIQFQGMILPGSC